MSVKIIFLQITHLKRQIYLDALQQQLGSSIIGSKQTVKEKPQTFLEESQADVMKSWSFPKFSTTTLVCVII
ncbi:hypothetical protein QUF56_20970 [Ureibacillus composti]|nr:hypothetical protein [Ureibacillus composti]